MVDMPHNMITSTSITTIMIYNGSLHPLLRPKS